MAHFYLQGLLLLVLVTVISECIVSSVIAFQEEDVALPCVNSNEMESKSCYRVKWIKFAPNSSQMKVILARPKTLKIQDAERVKWGGDGKGKISLFLTKLQKSDEGLYSCEIWQGWDCILVKNISLKVKECKTLQAVKPAPGTPVNLTCPVNVTARQQGSQDISWVKLKGSIPTPVQRSKRVEINGTSLAFQSVNYNDSGWYSCRYELGQTRRCFDINLLVQVENADTTTVPALTSARPVTSENIPPSTKEESNWPYIATASVTIVIVIIAVVMGLFIYRRRNAQSDAWQTQRHWAGNTTESMDEYENVHYSSAEDPLHQRVNSLYHQCRDENLDTFQ